MPTPAAEDQIQFLRHLQQLVDEGEFVSTYKFALLMALADLSVERGNDSGDELYVPVAAIAEKFIHYYWRQALPYPGAGTQQVLCQNTGKQAAVINALAAEHPQYRNSLVRIRRDARPWADLVRLVAKTVKTMPLWRLQKVGDSPHCFMYDHEPGADAIVLKPGVVYNFRQFYPMVMRIVQGAWADKVRTLSKNQGILGQRKDLAEFLFGSKRESLAVYQPILRDVQEGVCFYCGDKLHRSVAVDHFIPWARYPVDLGHNFVLAHTTCNRAKDDHLAGKQHLKAWIERNRNHGAWLAATFDRAGLIHDVSMSHKIAKWSYQQAADLASPAWVKSKRFEPVLKGWTALL